MTTIGNRGGTIRYAHHKQILFTLPNVELTTVTNKRNWNFDQVIIRDTVLPGEDQVVDDDEEI